MKLSVIVPVYNMASHGKLAFCLNSLLNQTMQDLEIIVVDDCSTDESLTIAKDFEVTHPGKIRVFQTPYNKKQGGARNLGLTKATGEWVAFVDSDDWVAPEMYETMIQKAESTGADVVGCDYNLVYTHTMEVGKIVANNTMDQTGGLDEEKHKKLFMRPGSMVIKIYKAEIIIKNQLHFPEEIFYEDNCAGPIWMLYFTHFEKVEAPFYYYYQLETSTVHGISEKKCQDRLVAGEMLLNTYRSLNLGATYETELEFRFTELYYVNTLFTYVIGIKHPHLSFLRKLRKGMQNTFPNFVSNPYYQATFDREQKKLINYHMKSPLFFLLYYKALTTYRTARRRLNSLRSKK